MAKRYKSPWMKGLVHEMPWGHYQDVVTAIEGISVAKVAVPEGQDGDLKLIMESPRLKRAILMMSRAMARYGHTFTEPFDNDPEMLDAIWEVKKCANLFKAKKEPKD